MRGSVLKQIADLQSRSYQELRDIWVSLFGGDPPAYNRQFIIKRLAYRIQELTYGGLPESVKTAMRDTLKQQRFDEHGVQRKSRAGQPKHREGVPIPGTRLIRDWNGRRYEVTVTHDGFDFEGRRYRSLTAVARAITGTHWNGRLFFGLKKEGVR